MIVKTPVAQRGFTLIELLVVIGIIALLAAITVPAIGNMKRSDAMTAATRQLLDDVGRARQLAISKHTTVYMVFVPAGFYSDPNFTSLPVAEQRKGDRLFDKQYTGYTFVTRRNVGDQPGRITPDYLGAWRTMPENTFIMTNKFAEAFFTNITDSATGKIYPINGFRRANKNTSVPFSPTIPFPSEDAWLVRQGNFVNLPFIAFNYLGQLTDGKDLVLRDEYIPVARGTVAHPRDPKTKKPRQGIPELIESPAGNSIDSFNLIHIDRLTGRARLIQQEISGT